MKNILGLWASVGVRFLIPVEVGDCTVHNRWHSYSGFDCMGTNFYPTCPHSWQESPWKENNLPAGRGKGLVVSNYRDCLVEGSDLLDPFGKGRLKALFKQGVRGR